MRTIFYGTPRIAVPFLELLARRTTVCAVISQPDQPSGRDLKTLPTPVKSCALDLGLTVLQPEKPSSIAVELGGLRADLAVVVAYGRLLRKDLLAVPRWGTLNVHFSLLPRYRGAAPVQWSLIRGETKTGVTLFWLDEGMDTGPILLQKQADIAPEDDAPVLFERLTSLGLSSLEEALAELETGVLRKNPQVGEGSLAPLLTRKDARLTFDRDALELHNLVRGVRVWPRAYLELKTPVSRMLVLKTAVGEPGPADGPPAGTIIRIERERGFLVQCTGRSRLWLLTVQPEGKKPVPAADFLNGLRLGAGDLLSLR